MFYFLKKKQKTFKITKLFLWGSGRSEEILAFTQTFCSLLAHRSAAWRGGGGPQKDVK